MPQKQEVTTRNWNLRYANERHGYILQDRRNNHLTYFHDIMGGVGGGIGGTGYFVRPNNDPEDDRKYHRTGKVPEDIPSLIKEELEHIKEHGSMRGPEARDS